MNDDGLSVTRKKPIKKRQYSSPIFRRFERIDSPLSGQRAVGCMMKVNNQHQTPDKYVNPLKMLGTKPSRN